MTIVTRSSRPQVRVRGFGASTDTQGSALAAQAAAASASAASAIALESAVSLNPLVSNQTGVTLALGDVVICDPSADSVAILSTKLRTKHPAVVLIGGAHGDDVTIANIGRHRVRILTSQAVEPGDHIVASAIGTFGQVDNDACSGSILLGIARTSKAAMVAGDVVVDCGIGPGGSRNRGDFVERFDADPNKGGTFVTADQAWQDYLASLEVDSYGLSGGLIEWPHGHFYFDDDVILPRAIIIDGTGGGFAGRSMTNIHLAVGKKILFDRFDGFGLDAAGAILRNVNVYCAPPGNFASAGNGIEMNSAGYCENVWVGYAGKNAYHVETGLDPANANDWFLYRCTASNIGVADRPDFETGNGVWAHGGDANAGGTVRFRSFNCLEAGIYDKSFLGNMHAGMHAEACGRGIRTSQERTARVTFLGSYSECAGADLVYSPACYFGGISEGGFGDSDGVIINDDGFQGLWASKWRGDAAALGNAGAKTGAMFFGSIGGLPIMFGWRADEEGLAANYAMIYNGGAGRPGCFVLNWGSGGGNDSLFVTSHKGKDSYWPIDFAAVTTDGLGGNRIGFARGGYLMHMWQDTGAAAPSASENSGSARATWNKRDKRWATANATIGAGKQGWDCTHSGTLGSYTEGRTATATGTNVITLNGATTMLQVGRVITVNGVTGRISVVSGTSVTLVDEDLGGGTRNVPAGSGLAIAFSAPTFAEF